MKILLKITAAILFIIIVSFSKLGKGDDGDPSITESRWTRLLGVPEAATSGTGIAVDQNGDIYVTGYTAGSLDGQAKTQYGFVLKYNTSGVKQGIRLFGAANAVTGGNDIAVDPSGDIYVTGKTTGNLDGQTKTGGYDAFVSKYDSSGVNQWTRLLGGASLYERGSSTTVGFGIAIDPNGNCYITGYTDANLDGRIISRPKDVFVAKYSSSGVKQWTKLLGASDPYIQSGTGIAVDKNGNCYVTGNTRGKLDGQMLTGDSDVFVIKLDSTGMKQWTRLLGVARSRTMGLGIAVDSSDNCYVTGHTGGKLNGQPKTGAVDLFVIKHNSSGARQWTRLLGSNALSETGRERVTEGRSIAIDASGNPYVTGWTNGNLDGLHLTGSHDVFVIKYDPSGVNQWTRLLGLTDASAEVNDIAVDKNGNCYVTGDVEGQFDGQTITGKKDAFVTARFNQNKEIKRGHSDNDHPERGSTPQETKIDLFTRCKIESTTGFWVGGQREEAHRVKCGSRWGFAVERKGRGPRKRLGSKHHGTYPDDGYQTIIPAVYEAAKDFSTLIVDGKKINLAWVKLNGKCGFINEKGTAVIPILYDSIDDFKTVGPTGSESYIARAELKGKYGYLNEKGEAVIPFIYENADSFYYDKDIIVKDSAQVKRDGKWGFIDYTGKETIPIRYDQIDSFQRVEIEGKEVPVALVVRNGKYGFMDNTGRIIISVEYERARRFQAIIRAGRRADIARVMRDGKWGFIDAAGSVVIPLKYEDTDEFHRRGAYNVARVKSRGKWIYIDDSDNQLDQTADFRTKP